MNHEDTYSTANLPTGYRIRFQNWSGQFRPFRAVAEFDGVDIGTTGGCKSRNHAERAAMKFVEGHRYGVRA